jgi:hypothetical protein
VTKTHNDVAAIEEKARGFMARWMLSFSSLSGHCSAPLTAPSALALDRLD